MAGYYVQLTYDAYVAALIPSAVDPRNETGHTPRFTFATTKEESLISAPADGFLALTPEEQITCKKTLEQINNVCKFKVVWVEHDQPHDVAV